jgi:hypothetical protein
MLNIKEAKLRWPQDVQDLWMKASWPVPLPDAPTIMKATLIISCAASLRSLLERRANGRDIEDVQVEHARELLNLNLSQHGLKAANVSGLVIRLYQRNDENCDLELMDLS